MTNDGRKDDLQESSSAEESMVEHEDKTTQISRTELAALREMADDMQLAPEQREKLEKSLGNPSGSEADSVDDSTQPLDHQAVQEHVANQTQQPATESAIADAVVEEARRQDEGDASIPDAGDDDDVGLAELSDDVFREVVFGDSPAPEPPPQDPATFDEDTPAVGFELEHGEEDTPPTSEVDLHNDSIERHADQSVVRPDDELEGMADQTGEETTEDRISTDVDEGETASAPPVAPPGTAEAPEQQTSGQPDDTAPDDPYGVYDTGGDVEPVDIDEGASFRGAESLLLQSLATLGGLALFGIGLARLIGEGLFTAIALPVAGMMVFVGFLLLVGGVLSWMD